MVNSERQGEQIAPEGASEAPNPPPTVNKRQKLAATVNTAPTHTALARELGISKAAITKLKSQGMPTHSADAARQWRVERLQPGRMRPDPGPSAATLLQRVHDLADLALRSAAVGRFDVVAADLRAAMAALPPAQRDNLVLPFELWELLIGSHAMNVMDMGKAPPAATDAMSDEDAADLGTLVFALATGKAYVR